jgi:hypothetical protein
MVRRPKIGVRRIRITFGKPMRLSEEQFGMRCRLKISRLLKSYGIPQDHKVEESRRGLPSLGGAAAVSLTMAANASLFNPIVHAVVILLVTQVTYTLWLPRLQPAEPTTHAAGEAFRTLAQKCQIKSAATIKASFLLGGMTGFALKLPLKAGASKAW